MRKDKDFEGRKVNYVWVKDRKGNEFACPVEELRDPESLTAAEMNNCFDDAAMAGSSNS